MRYVPGPDLGQLIGREGRLDPARAAEVTAQVGSALDAAHQSGLVHRDIKPANVLLAAGDGAEHAYLSDFGLTKRTSSETGITGTGVFIGTLDYVAPEQLRGERTDARGAIAAAPASTRGYRTKPSRERCSPLTDVGARAAERRQFSSHG